MARYNERLHSEILLLLPLLFGPDQSAQTQPPAVPEPVHETIVVTGTYEPLSLDEIDRSVTVLPVRDRSNVFNSIADVLRLDPSIDLEARAPDGVQNDLSIRGSGSSQTLVLLNGLRLDDAQSGHHNLDIPVPLDCSVAHRSAARLGVDDVRVGCHRRRD